MHTTLAILHISNAATESSSPYNEHVLPATLTGSVDIGMLTYFQPEISIPGNIQCHPGDGTFRGFFRELGLALNSRSYDIIHTHSPHVAFLVWLFLQLRRTPKPVLVHTVHSSFSNYKLRNRLFLVPVFFAFQRVVFCSGASFSSFPSFFQRILSSRSYTIPNGVDITRVDRTVDACPRTSPNRYFRIVTIGRLIPLKQPLTILQAFFESQLENAKLVFVGDGDLRTTLEHKIERADSTQEVEITGRVKRETVYELLGTADLYVSASTVEGLPVAVLEAMVAHCPLVLSDIPSHREVARGSDFIPLLPIGDVSAFAHHFCRYGAMSVEERKAIGGKCRELVEEHFSLKTMHISYVKLYHQLIEKGD